MKLKKVTEGVWFDYPEEKGVRLKIRSVPWSKALDIRSSVRKKIVMNMPDPLDPTKVIPQIVDDYDEGIVGKQLFYYALEAWEGIELESAATTDEIKEAMFDYAPIREFVIEKASELAKLDAKIKDDELKNSETSQSG
jgi:hypothetical protein